MRYEFSEHLDRDGWYIVTDTKWMMVCEFEAHRFNETQNFIDLGHLPVDPAKIAKAMTELGDWLFSHHYSDAMPVPTYEIRRTDDDSQVQVIRHKKPHLVITTPADDLNDLTELATSLEKAAEFLRKRVRNAIRK